jgi:aminoglycoside phosphotransferase (APT) family kinase protein
VLEEAVRARMEILRGKVDEESVTLVWETALRAPDWDRPPVWVHGDLDARNLLVRERRLAAVVDFGCLGVGDPACDVAVPGKSSRVKRATPSGTHCRPTTRPGRGPGAGSSTSRWALSYYTVDSNPTLFTEARRWLAEVLAD